MTVIAVSAKTRDSFLRCWPLDSARRKVAAIRDYGLITWHPFETLYVGMLSYPEQTVWAEEELPHAERHRNRHFLPDSNRSWWQSVRDLQSFVGSKD